MDIDKKKKSEVLNPAFRTNVIAEIQGEENKKRKKESFRQTEIYNGRFDQYIYEYLCTTLSPETANNMPRINTINICKRMIDQRASLYKRAPTREFTGLTEDQAEKMLLIYEDMMVDEALLKSSRLFELQNQNTIKIVAKHEKLQVSVKPMHRIDAVPVYEIPEKPSIYVESEYNRSANTVNSGVTDNGIGSDKVNANDGHNQKIGDKNDYDRKTNYVWWDRANNFMTDCDGRLITEEYPNPIGRLPFIDVARGKDDEFFVRSGNSSADFTIQYNAAFSSYWFVVQLQGFSIGILLTPVDQDNQAPVEFSIGPAKYLHFTYDPVSGHKPELSFVSPSPDLAGTQEFITSLLSNYLTAEGLDPSTITGKGDGKSFTSGLERLLAMIENFEATKEAQVAYERVEKELFDITKRWINNYSDRLGEKYKLGVIPENSEIVITYDRPEAVKTEMDVLEEWEKKKEIGSHSDIDMIMDIHKLSKEDAVVKLREIRGFDIDNATEEREYEQQE